MLLNILIVVGTLICSIQAIRSNRLLISALWLAGSSALVALLLYMLGAAEVAVIELSVGAGLVTVIFVFAINIAGEESFSIRRLIPRPITWGLLAVTVVLLGGLTLSHMAPVLPGIDALPFAKAVWEVRGLDALLQVIIIFSGVLGLLGLLAENSGAGQFDPISGDKPGVKL
ncbi:MAG TPA: hydrogenase subunit MbhD domain-containing protein [Anaerolineaceae bacterium]|jgi:uncharacterized MnhB-related membrane protein